MPVARLSTLSMFSQDRQAVRTPPASEPIRSSSLTMAAEFSCFWLFNHEARTRRYLNNDLTVQLDSRRRIEQHAGSLLTTDGAFDARVC